MKQAAWKARIKEVFMQAVFFIAACASILAVILICVFLFANGLPAIGKIGPMEFLLGTRWKPGNNIFGILPFILGSIYVTAGAILIGVPIGILTSIFMAISSDGIHWRRLPEPLISYGEPGSLDSLHAHKPCILWHDGVLYHFYCAVRPTETEEERRLFGREYRCLTVARSTPFN